jgi:uncharacterized phiE125 gp8 family phage protein
VDDDNLIRGLIKAARVWAERHTGVCLIEQTVEEVWDFFPEYGVFELSMAPLSEVTKVEYRNDAAAYTTWASSNYTVDTYSYPPRVVAKSTLPPSISLQNQMPNLWRVTYKAGTTTAKNVDANVKTAMLLQIGMMYENREDIPILKNGANPTARSAYALLSLSRVNLI